MAKRNKREQIPTPDQENEKPIESVDDSIYQVDEAKVGEAEIEEEGNLEQIAGLNKELAKKYGKKAGSLASRGTKWVGRGVYGASSMAEMGGVGGLVGLVGGTWKATKGILKTVKDIIFDGGGGILDHVIPKDIKDGLVRGFKATREKFKTDDKDKKEKK